MNVTLYSIKKSTRLTKGKTMETFEKIRIGKERVALRLFVVPLKYISGVTFHVNVVYVDDVNKNHVQSMGFYSNYFTDKHQYKGLCVKAVMYANEITPTQYDIHIDTDRDSEVTIERAMAMVKTLKPIKRKLLEISQVEPQADTFEEYICHLAKILKVESFYHPSTTSKTDRTEYRNDNVLQLRDMIRSMIDANIESLSVA
jgi:hypothetical protein